MVTFSSGTSTENRPTEVEESTPSFIGGERSEQELSFLWLLWERRHLLSRALLWGLVGSIVVAILIPTKYESTARLMPPDDKPASGLATMVAAITGGGGITGSIGSELLGLKSNSELFVGILRSRTVEDNLIRKFNLQKVYWHSTLEDTRKELERKTEVSVDRKSQIISVTVFDKSPQRAAAMAEAYVEELNRLVAELSMSSARRERIFLENRLQTVYRDLEKAEVDLSQFSSSNATIDVKEQGRAMVEAAAMLQGQIIAAQSEYEGLLQIYTANNARVRAAKARIDELRRQQQKLSGSNVKGEPDTDSADQPYPSIRKLPILGVQWADLYRRAKIQETVLEVLTKQYEMAKVQEVKELPTVKVLDAPNVPEKKSFPPRFLIVILGTVVVFGCCVGFIFAEDQWQSLDPTDVRKRLAREIYNRVAFRWRNRSSIAWKKLLRQSSGIDDEHV